MSLSTNISIQDLDIDYDITSIPKDIDQRKERRTRQKNNLFPIENE